MNKIYNIVEQIAILAKLANEHTWHVGRVFGNTDSPLFDISKNASLDKEATYEANDVWVTEFGK